ncbi:hypothetical protein SLA2020_378470 [Shorea laevis]
MVLKMDMEKAFDRMEWNYILAILIKLGFHSSWVNWIKICISSPSFSILINGSPFGHFSPARGFRQGDPLSPFLFILGSEVLSRLLFKEEAAGCLKGLKIARRCPAISHLLFADDLLIFGRASISEAACIKACLAKYSTWSGQSINANKSSIFFSKIPPTPLPPPFYLSSLTFAIPQISLSWSPNSVWPFLIRWVSKHSRKSAR